MTTTDDTTNNPLYPLDFLDLTSDGTSPSDEPEGTDATAVIENTPNPSDERDTPEHLESSKFWIACDVLREMDPLGLDDDRRLYGEKEYDGEAALIANCIAANAEPAEAEHAVAMILGAACELSDAQSHAIAQALLAAWADSGVNRLRETDLLSIEETLERLNTAAKEYGSPDAVATGIPLAHDALRYLIWVFEEDDAPRDAVAARDALLSPPNMQTAH